MKEFKIKDELILNKDIVLVLGTSNELTEFRNKEFSSEDYVDKTIASNEEMICGVIENSLSQFDVINNYLTTFNLLKLRLKTELESEDSNKMFNSYINSIKYRFDRRIQDLIDKNYDKKYYLVSPYIKDPDGPITKIVTEDQLELQSICKIWCSGTRLQCEDFDRQLTDGEINNAIEDCIPEVHYPSVATVKVYDKSDVVDIALDCGEDTWYMVAVQKFNQDAEFKKDNFKLEICNKDKINNILNTFELPQGCYKRYWLNCYILAVASSEDMLVQMFDNISDKELKSRIENSIEFNL